MHHLIIKQMFDASGKALDEGFRSVAAVQENAEKMLNGLWGKSQLFHETGEKIFRDWFSDQKKSLSGYQAKLHSYLNLVETYFLGFANQVEQSRHAISAQKESALTKRASRKPAAQKETVRRKRRTARKITN